METRSKAQRETVGADAGRLSPGIGEGDTHPARDPTPPVLTPVGVRATPVLTDESLSEAEQHQEHARLPPRLEISTYLIFPETRVIGLHFCRCMYGSTFIQFCEVASKRRIFSAPECVLAVQGRSGSSKVDNFGTNRKRICDFLLVVIVTIIIKIIIIIRSFIRYLKVETRKSVR